MKLFSRVFLIFSIGLITTSLFSNVTKSDHIITFFIERYPELKKQIPLSPSLFTPDRIYKAIAKNAIQKLGVQNIYATYGGYLAFTSPIGQITFPRKTQAPKFDLFITNNLEPNFMAGTTNIRSWQLVKDNPAARFSVERHHDSQSKPHYYWQVTKAELPKGKNIPLHSIVVFAKPKNIYVPLGITKTNDDPQFILPPIYARPQLDDVKNANLVMNLKAFFQPVQFKQKTTGLAELQMIK